MSVKNLLSEYRKRLSKEAWLKSIVWGAVFAFGANAVAALATWCLGVKSLKLVLCVSLGVFVAVWAASSALLYFLKFRPTFKDVARRVDGLGLEERVITMTEYEKKEDFFAKKQRQDAAAKLKSVKSGSLKIVVSAASIIVACVMLLTAGAATTASALSAKGIIRDLPDIVEPIFNPEVFYTIIYEVEGAGEIEGNADQLVLKGGDAEPVLAVAEDGWAFLCWSDGSEEPYRHDKEVMPDGEFSEVDEDGNVIITYFAVFTELEESEQDGNGGEGDEQQQEQDQAQDQPSDGEEQEQEQQQTDGDGESKDGDGKGGEYQDSNKVIDGDQYYGDRLEEYLALAEEILENDGEIPDDLREFIESYYGTIE